MRTSDSKGHAVRRQPVIGSGRERLVRELQPGVRLYPDLA